MVRYIPRLLRDARDVVELTDDDILRQESLFVSLNSHFSSPPTRFAFRLFTFPSTG